MYKSPIIQKGLVYTLEIQREIMRRDWYQIGEYEVPVYLKQLAEMKIEKFCDLL